MAQADFLFQSFNVGQVDTGKLHRIDLTKMRLAAEEQTNILPLSDGRGVFRPGLGYLATVKDSNPCRAISFIAGNQASYGLELTNGILRVLDCATDTIITRPAPLAQFGDDAFSLNNGSWTLAATAGQTSTINAVDIDGASSRLILQARAHGAEASASQSIAVTPNVTIGINTQVVRGRFRVRIGSAAGLDDLMQDQVLETGHHSLAVNPGVNVTIFVKIYSRESYSSAMENFRTAPAGVMEITTPWDADDIWLLQPTQSLDVMFLAGTNVKPMRIERKGDGAAGGFGWSVVEYKTEDGPFTPVPTAPIKLTPSATEGDITINADTSFFKSTHVGALFKIWHTGQRIDTYLAANEEYTPTFIVTGIMETNFVERQWAYTISGTWVGTLRHFRSFDGEDIEFHPFRKDNTTGNIDITANAGPVTNDDNDDNVVAWYKIGFSSYTSGEARIIITYTGGGGYGIARITRFVSATQVQAQVLLPFKGITASEDWQEGVWSDYRGFPSGAALGNGRLFWVGSDAIWGSVSDAYHSFDEEFNGDAGPIQRAIALGGRNEARWIMTLSQLLVGCDSRIASIRASSLDEVLTPSNFDVKNSDKVPASTVTPIELKHDRGLFVADNDVSLYELNFDTGTNRYIASRFSLLNEELFASGITQLAALNFPDQRVFCTINDDDAVMVLYEPLLDIVAVIPIATREGDVIESIMGIPGTTQDRLYAIVRREVNGSTVRYWEKLALDHEARPASVCKVMDSHISGTGAHSATIAGLSHLEGETVVAWVDGAPVETSAGVRQEFVVTGGQITLPVAPTAGWCVGLPYRARYKSARLAYGDAGTSPFLNYKALARVGLLLADYARKGVKFGGQFDDANHPLTSLPELDDRGRAADLVVQGNGRDEFKMPLDGDRSTDPRLCIEINSPYPATLRAIVMVPDV